MIQRANHLLVSAREAIELELDSNVRFRRMVWLVGYIIVVYIIVGLSEFNAALQDDSVAMQAEVSRIARGADTAKEIWNERLDQEKKTQDQIIQHCRVMDDLRLASADMQTEIQRLYRAHDLKNSRLSLSDPESLDLFGNRKGWLVRGEIKGRISLSRLPALVNSLENSETRFFVRELGFVKQRNSGTLTLVLAACFVRDETRE